MIFLEKIFSILSIIFFLITSFFLVINCFEEKIFELSFASLFSFFFFLNQCIFIPGSIKINKREYESKIIHNCQIYTAVVMLVALFVSELYEISDRMSLCIFGNLLLIFLTFYSIQNMFYTYHYDFKKRIHVARRILISIFCSSCYLVVFFYLLITYFRGFYG